MSKYEQVNWGFLGTGLIADWMANDLKTTIDHNIVAVGSRTIEMPIDLQINTTLKIDTAHTRR